MRGGPGTVLGEGRDSRAGQFQSCGCQQEQTQEEGNKCMLIGCRILVNHGAMIVGDESLGSIFFPISI